MIFVTMSPTQAAQYSYMCARLKQMVNRMHTTRKTLEGIANTSFDKSFAKSVYMLTSESLQCENEIRSQIDSLNCVNNHEEEHSTKEAMPLTPINELNSLCNYFEEACINPYKKLLKDRQIGVSLKNLINYHLQLFTSSVTQLRLFNDVQNAVN